MNQMKDKAIQISEQLNALSLRERVIILAVVLVAILGIYDYVALTPYMDQHKENQQRTVVYANEMAEIQDKINLLVKRLENDPNLILKERIAKKEAQVKELEEVIGASTEGLIQPKKMSQVLGYLLSKQSGMGVRAVKNYPAEPIAFKKDEQSEPEVLMFKHRLTLELDGTFFQVAGYLKMIEGLKERLYWDDMNFIIKQYPKGEFVLEVHTLSMSKELIGIYE